LLDFRSPLMAWAAPAGLVLAALAWLVLHGLVFEPTVAGLEKGFAASRPVSADRVQVNDLSPLISRIAAAPIFALTTGPGAVTETQVQLEGLAITPKSKAALLVVDGKAATWYDLGASRDGITVMEIGASRVTVDTATGFKEVGLFDKPAAAPANGAVPAKPGSNAVPPGFRTPPPPASAPIVSR